MKTKQRRVHNPVRAITFDFYETLVFPRFHTGRGARYKDYLESCGLSSRPWQHQFVYDLFEYYDEAYHPSLSEPQKIEFWVEFTRRLFVHTDVRNHQRLSPEDHAETIRQIFGPEHFALYPEVPAVLQELGRRGMPVAIVSNWPKGLHHFCCELNLPDCFDPIIASADLGIEKPDPRIFAAASQHLGFMPGDILHVGDTLVDDIEGGQAAGCQVALINRRCDNEPVNGEFPVVTSLTEILAFLEPSG